MNNRRIAERFREIADTLELGAANPFRVRAYRRAARALDQLKEDIARVAQTRPLEKIPGIGPDLAAKILEFVQTGVITDPPLEKERSGERDDPLPPAFLDLVTEGVLDSRLARFIHRRFHIDDLDDLRRLVQSRLLRTLPAFSPDQESKILKGLDELQKRPSHRSS